MRKLEIFNERLRYSLAPLGNPGVVRNFCSIILSQYVGGKYGIDPCCRTNSDFVFSFMLKNEEHRDVFVTQYLSLDGFRDGDAVFRSITTKDFTMIAVDNGSSKPDKSNIFKYKASMKKTKFMIGEPEFISARLGTKIIMFNGKRRTIKGLTSKIKYIDDPDIDVILGYRR